MNPEVIVSSPILQDWLNPALLHADHLTSLQKQFENSQPFSHLYLDEFLTKTKLEEIIEELSEQEFEYKESDLFQLAQTPDFDDLDVDILADFKNLLRSQDFLTFIEFITGESLSDDVDCLGNIYQDTDHLLCHDDKLIKRKIAYILYLTSLDEEDGGALHLFDTNEDHLPRKIVKKIYPQANRLAFFQVTRYSFHEVGEILQPDTFRVSISGWFNNE